MLLGDEHTRNAMNGGNFKWENKIVPYIFDATFSAQAKSAVEQAIIDYNKFTCIRFVPRTNEYNYIHFISADGCYSYVGRAYGAQPISLGSGCEIKGIALHEMAHSLGFYHEQSRSDRDDYITINWPNIPLSSRSQFDKQDTNNLNTRYDYDSVMHYGSKSFSNNGSPTIVPKNASVTIGQRRGFSTTDIFKINQLYDCPTGNTPSPVKSDSGSETTTQRPTTISSAPVIPATPLSTTTVSRAIVTTVTPVPTTTQKSTANCVDQWSPCTQYYNSPTYRNIVCVYYKGICKRTCNACD